MMQAGELPDLARLRASRAAVDAGASSKVRADERLQRLVTPKDAMKVECSKTARSAERELLLQQGFNSRAPNLHL